MLSKHSVKHNWQGSSFYTFVKRIGLMMVTGSILRLLFFMYNFRQFPSSDIETWATVCGGGLLFDWIFSWYLLIPLFFATWVERNKSNLWLYYTGKAYFLFVTLILVMLTAIDAMYFPISKVRSGIEILGFTEQNNISIFTYIRDYWFTIIVIALLLYLCWILYPKGNSHHRSRLNTALFLFFIPLAIFIARGGSRLKPLHVTDAILFAPEGPWELTLNSGLVFAQSYLDRNSVRPSISVPDKADPGDLQHFERPGRNVNICLIILESFGKEYTGFNKAGRNSYTPFLDSLGRNGLYFSNYYAAGLKSMDAVPALISSIPALLNEPFIQHSASMTPLTSLAALLKELGYESSFFHGADPGSMGFRSFLLRNGFDRYYSRQEFTSNRNEDYGEWGVHDGPYLQFALSKMNQMKQPFFGSIFTLSSHHPYELPHHLSTKFEEGTLPIHKSIRYTDDALRAFFHVASQQPWYAQTLFVITADHTSINETPTYQNPLGRYEIPLIFYGPGLGFQGVNPKVGSQIDLMPTILEITGYPENFISPGRSLLDSSQEGSCIQYFQGSYTFRKGPYFIQASSSGIERLHHIDSDPEAIKNLKDTEPQIANNLYEELKTHLGSFHYRLSHRQLSK